MRKDLFQHEYDLLNIVFLDIFIARFFKFFLYKALLRLRIVHAVNRKLAHVQAYFIIHILA